MDWWCDAGAGLTANKSNKFGVFLEGLVLELPPTAPGAVGSCQEWDGAEQDFSCSKISLWGPLSGPCFIPWEGTSSSPPLPSQASAWNSGLSPLEGSSTLSNAPTAHNPPPPNLPSRAPPLYSGTQGWARVSLGALESGAPPKKGYKFQF